MLDRSTLRAQYTRRFGGSNPESIDLEFWHHMVRAGMISHVARDEFDLGADEFYESPLWCFHRFGSTRTQLPDGTVVCIGGEHEDYYDPDFCIYNDVIIVRPDGSITIFGYPREVFTPTDFHTATLCGNRIIIIGRLGYREDRDEAQTPVYALSTDTWKIERLSPSGQSPGFVYDHHAERVDRGNAPSIVLTGGKLVRPQQEQRVDRSLTDAFVLSVPDMRWSRLTVPLPDRYAVPQLTWPTDWESVIEFDRAKYELNQVFHAMPVGHEFFACQFRPWAIGTCGGHSATVHKLTDHTDRVAMIYADELEEFEHSKLPLPTVHLFPDLEHWRRFAAQNP